MFSHLLSYETLLRLAVFVLLGLVFWGLSLRFPMHGFGLQKVKRFDGFFIVIALLLAGLAEEFLTPAVMYAVGVMHQLWQYSPLHEVILSDPAKLGLYLVCVDFCSYWLHRLMHTHTFWCCHAFHHSPKTINWLSGARGSPLHMAFIVLPGLVFSTLFFIHDGATIFYIIVLIEITSQHLTHTNLQLPFEKQLEWFLVTPRMHFIHHNHDKQFGDSNFGSYFSVWDHLFGTYTDPSTVPNKDHLGLDVDYTMGSLILGVRLKEVTQKVDA